MTNGDWQQPDRHGALPLRPEECESLAGLDRAWAGGDRASLAEIERILPPWRARLCRPEGVAEERFDLVAHDGRALGWSAPRWLCHLTGLRHRAVHVLLLTPQGLLLLQVRARHKAHWPKHLDVSASGHLKQGQSWEEAAWSELEEELGLADAQRERWLEGGALHKLGECYERRDLHGPPSWLRNRQHNQAFWGRLTAQGLAQLCFADGEVGGVLLCPVAEALRRVVGSDPITPGLRDTMEIFVRADKGGLPAGSSPASPGQEA